MSEPFVLRKEEHIVADAVVPARRIRERMRGLLGTDDLPGGGGLLVNAKQVHTFGMRYPIDLIFCDASWEVVKVLRSVPPNRLTRIVVRARRVIELPAGRAEAVHEGDRLTIDQSRSSTR